MSDLWQVVTLIGLLWLACLVWFVWAIRRAPLIEDEDESSPSLVAFHNRRERERRNGRSA